MWWFIRFVYFSDIVAEVMLFSYDWNMPLWNNSRVHQLLCLSLYTCVCFSKHNAEKMDTWKILQGKKRSRDWNQLMLLQMPLWTKSGRGGPWLVRIGGKKKIDSILFWLEYGGEAFVTNKHLLGETPGLSYIYWIILVTEIHTKLAFIWQLEKQEIPFPPLVCLLCPRQMSGSAGQEMGDNSSRTETPCCGNFRGTVTECGCLHPDDNEEDKYTVGSFPYLSC